MWRISCLAINYICDVLESWYTSSYYLATPLPPPSVPWVRDLRFDEAKFDFPIRVSGLFRFWGMMVPELSRFPYGFNSSRLINIPLKSRLSYVVETLQ